MITFIGVSTHMSCYAHFFFPFRANIMLRRCAFLAFINASCYAAACIFYWTPHMRHGTHCTFFCHTYVMPRRCTLWSFGAVPHFRHAFPLFTFSLFQFHRCVMLCHAAVRAFAPSPKRHAILLYIFPVLDCWPLRFWEKFAI